PSSSHVRCQRSSTPSGLYSGSMDSFYGAISADPGVYLDPRMCKMGSNMTRYHRLTRYLRRSRIRNRQTSYPKRSAVPTAALAECTCPEYCERDHDNE